MMRAGIGGLIVLSLVFLAAAVTLRNIHPGVAAAKGSEEQFVVASEADAGPGTLRDAILAADRLPGHARILITAKRISVETPLPALVNPRGIEIEAATNAGILDGERQAAGPMLHINSPASMLRGLHIVHAHSAGFIVNAPGVQLDTIQVSDSKVGVFLGNASKGSVIRTSIFERNETALTGDADVHDVTVLGSIFRENTRAGFWFVGAAAKVSAGGGANDTTVHEQVRLVDDVFEKNASGVVIANRPTLVQKSRFIGNRESAVNIMGGAARVEDSEITGTGGTAISVTSGRAVMLSHNQFVDNAATAIMVRDSDVTIERNTLQHNGFGIVSISTQPSLSAVIRDNIITGTTADAVTLIGGTPEVQRNQLVQNHGAGLRSLDLVTTHGSVKATPHLDANVIHGNGVDIPAAGVYKLADAL